MDLPLATYVAHIGAWEDGRLTVDRLVEEGYQILSLPLPALISVVKEAASPRLPTLNGKKRSMTIDIPVYNTENLDHDPSFLGLKGSPTQVVKIETPKVTRGGVTVLAPDDASVAGAVDQLVEFLDRRGLL